MESYNYGAMRSPKDARDYRVNVDQNFEFPDEYSVKDMPKAKSQGQVGSCTGHGVALVAEYHNLAQHNIHEPLSAGFIYGYRHHTLHKGKGLCIRDGLKTLKLLGIPYQEDFPYNKEVPKIIELVDEQVDKKDEEWDSAAYNNRCSCYFKLNNEKEIKYALMHYGPVLIGIPWYKGYSSAISVMKIQDTKNPGCHCMVIYGWNKTGWKVQNSWGFFWGICGRSVLPYPYKIYESWGVADDIDDNIKVPVRDTKFRLRKLFCSICNLITRFVDVIMNRG